MQKKDVIRTTFALPSNLKEKLDTQPGINWPEIIRKNVEEKLEQLEKLQEKGEITW